MQTPKVPNYFSEHSRVLLSLGVQLGFKKDMEDLLSLVTLECSPASPVKYLHLSDRVIAYRHLEGISPTLVYVGGFLSTMETFHKAALIEQYAKVQGRASIRYDQASVGLSTGVDRKDATNEVHYTLNTDT